MDSIVILGGGTFSYIRNHLSLAAPAFGNTAKKLHTLIHGSKLYLTKMADSNSDLITNDDVSNLVDNILLDMSVKTIIMNVAFCDYDVLPINDVFCGAHAERLSTSDGDISITLSPAEKVIKRIKDKRPDIFLVGFKTTTNKSIDEQIEYGRKAIISNNSDIIFCNDTCTRNNILVIKNDENYISASREDALEKLAFLINKPFDLFDNTDDDISPIINMNKDEYRNRVFSLLDRILTYYSQANQRKYLEPSEYPDEFFCNLCQGDGNFEINGIIKECWKDYEHGDCVHTELDTEEFCNSFENELNEICELISITHI